MSLTTNNTSEQQINEMKSLVEQWSGQAPIVSCEINDWGRFGNFEIIVRVSKEAFANTRKNVLTKQINALIDRSLKTTNAHRRQTFSPEATRTTRYGSTAVTYDRKCWHIDIDYHAYNATVNRFSD